MSAMNGGAILARYPGRCVVCGDPIRRFDDYIVPAPGGWRHDDCGEPDDQEREGPK